MIDARATAPGPLPELTLTNRSRIAFRLRVAPALAVQAPQGGLKPLRGRRNAALARRAVRLTAPGLLKPNTNARVAAAFLGYAGRRSLTVALTVVATPLRQPRTGIRYRAVLVGALFVHRPAATPIPSIASVRTRRLSALRRHLVAHVRNRGLAPAFVTAVRFRVLLGRRLLATVAATPGFVAPRSARDFAADLFHRLPSGRIRIEAVVRLGARVTRRSTFVASRSPAHPAPASSRNRRWSFAAAGPRAKGTPSTATTGSTSRTDDEVKTSSAASRSASGNAPSRTS